ncbi:MAG TPA: hypothetical protein VNV60_04520 [Holophagaceae bacterium]|jgi:hypothetical protein|nr:hypothetical protein [Holophagaceae bacterium]
MSDGQAAPKKGMNPILKWLLIGCGTIVVLMLGSCVLITYACKGAVRSFGSMAVVSGVEAMKPSVTMMLPPDAKAQGEKAFHDLADKASKLDAQDMKDISEAIKTYNEATQAKAQAGQTPIDPEAAKALVARIQEVADRH